MNQLDIYQRAYSTTDHTLAPWLRHNELCGYVRSNKESCTCGLIVALDRLEFKDSDKGQSLESEAKVSRITIQCVCDDMHTDGHAVHDCEHCSE